MLQWLQTRYAAKWAKVYPIAQLHSLLLVLMLIYLISTVCLLFAPLLGTFGQVLECWDKERKEMVAIKIVRGIKKYREAAMIEIEVLQQLGKHDKGGNR